MNQVPTRYKMNTGVLTNEEYNKLTQTKILVVGLGGLGGNVVNLLVRLGVRDIVLVDFDNFTESNLNRQLFSNETSIGRHKVDVVVEELLKIDQSIQLEKQIKRVQEYKPENIDYIVDCTDNLEAKIYLSNLSKELDIPLLHGSCGGWYGQVGWIQPGFPLIERMYKGKQKGLEEELLNPPFAPSVVAAYMVSEFTKMIKKDKNTVINQLLLIDLHSNSLIKTGGD